MARAPNPFWQFEQAGEIAVRRALELGRYAGPQADSAQTWLARLEAERQRREESLSEQVDIARSAKDASWAAAEAALDAAREANAAKRKANVAIGVAAVAVVVAIVAIIVDIVAALH